MNKKIKQLLKESMNLLEEYSIKVGDRYWIMGGPWKKWIATVTKVTPDKVTYSFPRDASGTDAYATIPIDNFRKKVVHKKALKSEYPISKRFEIEDKLYFNGDFIEVIGVEGEAGSEEITYKYTNDPKKEGQEETKSRDKFVPHSYSLFDW